MSNKKKILLSAGGTGGHFFPAISLAEELTNLSCDVHIITDNRCKKYLNNDSSFTSYIVDLYISSNGLFNKIKSGFKVIFSCLKAYFLVKKIAPDVVVGFGGYPSFPAMFASKLLKIPMVIYEQNSFLGNANSFFKDYTKIIALSYKDTKNISKKYKKKTVLVNEIVRPAIKSLPKKNNFNVKIFTILVFGGSQGAKIFTDLIPSAIEIVKKANPEFKIRIIQQVKKSEESKLASYYKSIGVSYELAEFFDNMPENYKKSQLVISRSGASTIAEISAIGLPAIFIPLPNSKEDHQYFNAKSIANINGSWCYRQDQITPQKLAKKIHRIISDRSYLITASKNLLSRDNSASDNLANTVLKII